MLAHANASLYIKCPEREQRPSTIRVERSRLLILVLSIRVHINSVPVLSLLVHLTVRGPAEDAEGKDDEHAAEDGSDGKTSVQRGREELVDEGDEEDGEQGSDGREDGGGERDEDEERAAEDFWKGVRTRSIECDGGNLLALAKTEMSSTPVAFALGHSHTSRPVQCRIGSGIQSTERVKAPMQLPKRFAKSMERPGDVSSGGQAHFL